MFDSNIFNQLRSPMSISAFLKLSVNFLLISISQFQFDADFQALNP